MHSFFHSFLLSSFDWCMCHFAMQTSEEGVRSGTKLHPISSLNNSFNDSNDGIDVMETENFS